jgi:hypothetical protein
MVKLVYGVGINDADYVVRVQETTGYANGKQKQKRVLECPFYVVWTSMIARGYSEKFKLKRPTYKDCAVCTEWHRFSTFKSWMEKQDWEGNQLDKDLLVQGNKVYSPETCVFVSGQVNTFLTDSGATRGEYKIGVYYHRQNCKYIAQCRNPFTTKSEHLGCYTTEEEAHQAWLDKKLEHAYALAALQTDERIVKALVDRYENYN